MEKVEDKIEKLLRVAAGSANENESAVALRMAQKLADAHNLDIGTIGKAGDRKDEKISKGLYQYQRNLYAALAELNHCKSWLEKGTRKGQSYQIRLLGSKVNVTVTRNMADYLEDAVNRMVREQFGGGGSYFSKDANAFRVGMVDTLVKRVRDRRREEEAERERAKREQQTRAAHPGAAVENAIVLISDVSQREAAANFDYLHGEGAWDRQQAEVEANRVAREKSVQQYEDWVAANPEAHAAQQAEFAAQFEKRQKREEYAERRRERERQERIDKHGYDPRDYKSRKKTAYDNDAYWQGRDKGEDVGLDEQIDKEDRKGIAA